VDGAAGTCGAETPRTFRILAFSDRARELDAQALAPTPVNVARARRFLEDLDAGGGTEMIRAVETALALAEDRARLRLIALVSDGWVGDEDQVLASIGRNLGHARLFCIGIGAAPNRYLLERAAEMGRGDVQSVGLGEDPVRAAATFAARIDRPVLTDISIDWGGLAVHDVYPRTIPDLYADRPVLLHGRYDSAARGTVRLRGTLGGEEWSASVEAVLPERADGHEALPSVWARSRIHDLETAMFLRSSDALREQIAQTGLRHGLVTSETSFVAVDDSPPEPASRAPAAAVPGNPDPGQSVAAADAARPGDNTDMLSGSMGYGSAAPAPTAMPVTSESATFDGGNGIVQGALLRPDGELSARRASRARAGLSMMPRPPTKTAPMSARAESPAPPSPGRSTTDLLTTLRRNRAGVQRCWAAESSTSAARLSMRVVIGPDGRVISVTPEASSGRVRLDQCIAGALRSLSFPRSRTAGNRSIVYPLLLQPGTL
jgi:Ca-activated chloride channel family protein